MTFKIKDIFFMTIIFVSSYIAIPLFILKYYENNNLDKFAFIILLLLSFFSFGINLIYTYFRGRYFVIPLLSVAISILLIFVFNSSAILLIILIALFSFLGVYLGTIFSKKI